MQCIPTHRTPQASTHHHTANTGCCANQRTPLALNILELQSGGREAADHQWPCEWPAAKHGMQGSSVDELSIQDAALSSVVTSKSSNPQWHFVRTAEPQERTEEPFLCRYITNTGSPPPAWSFLSLRHCLRWANGAYNKANGVAKGIAVSGNRIVPSPSLVCMLFQWGHSGHTNTGYYAAQH